MASIWGEFFKGSNSIGVNHESPEWERMWSALFTEYEEYKCPQSLEVWQYMGTWNTPEGWAHQFRHRSYYDARKYVNVAPSAEFMAEIPQILAEVDK